MARLFSFLLASTAALRASASYCPGGTGTTSVSNEQTVFAGCGYGCSAASVDLGDVTSSCFPFCDRAVATATAPCSVFVSDSDADYTSKVDSASSSFYGAAAATSGASPGGDGARGGTAGADGGTAVATDGSAGTAASAGASSTITSAITSKAQGTGTAGGAASTSTSASSAGAGAARGAWGAWGAWAAAGLAAAGPGVAAVLL